jgi:hypothetical protein
MDYKTGEVLAQRIVEGVAGFSSNNVGRGSKWRLLNSGNAEVYAVLRKGQHTETFFTMSLKEQRYRTVVEVIQRVKENLDDRYDELLEHVADITARFDAYRKLDDDSGDLRDANITGGDEVKEIWLDNGRVFAWTGESEVTYAE